MGAQYNRMHAPHGQRLQEWGPHTVNVMVRLSITTQLFNSYSAEIDYSRQNLTSVDVRF